MSLRHLVRLTRIDALLAWRSRLPHVVVALAVGFGLLVRFALPADFEPGVSLYVHDGTPDAVFSGWLAEALPDAQRPASDEALRAAIADDATSVGLSLSGTPEAPRATLRWQGHESPQGRAIMETTAWGLWVEHGGLPRPSAHTLTLLRPQAAPVPFNLTFLPLILAMDTIFLGGLFVAAMVFQDKGAGTLAAWRIAPPSSAAYLGSKLLVNAGLALLYTLIVVPLGGVGGADWPALLALVLVASVIMSAGGALLGAWFESMSAALYPMAFFSIVLSVPIFVYTVPGVVVDAARWLPTWPVIFGFRELLFPTGREGALLTALAPLVPWVVGAVAFAWYSVDRRLMREVS
ncbi:MAG: ABC transporter permease [Alphaproteobacteria bacterium]|nr:ABC transporter permease [Alphaproteobacteria bacterium]